MGAGAAGDLGGGLGEAGEDLAEGVGAGEQLDEFEGDVAAVKVGEDEHVGATGDGAIDLFGASDDGVEGGIHLDLAIDLDIEAESGGLGASEFGGAADLE